MHCFLVILLEGRLTSFHERDYLVMIDVLTLNYNDSKTTVAFTGQMLQYDCISNILIVDNNSNDNSIDEITREYGNESRVTIIKNEHNGGYGSGNNLGIRYLSENFNSEYILLSNPDVVIDEETIVYLEEFIKTNNYSIVAPFMCDKNGKRQYNSAFRIPSCIQYIFSFEMLYSKFCHPCFYKGLCSTTNDVLEVDGVSGSLFVMSATDMIKYGMFDENIFLYAEEIALSFKMKKANKKIALLPKVFFIHNHSVSINKTYKTEVKKQKICLKSQLYIVKRYYNASMAKRLLSWFFAGISIVEHAIYGFLKERNF